MENRQNVRWHFLMATDSKKRRYSYDFSFLYRFFYLQLPELGSNQQPFGLTAECSTIELSRNTSGIFS